jgi:hypothetical protein
MHERVPELKMKSRGSELLLSRLEQLEHFELDGTPGFGSSHTSYMTKLRISYPVPDSYPIGPVARTGDRRLPYFQSFTSTFAGPYTSSA